MSDALDREIRTMVHELIESSPTPHPAQEVFETRIPSTALTLGSGIGRMLLVGAVVLVVGVAGVWLSQSLVTGEIVGEVPIVDGTRAPTVDFDPSEYGEEVRLLSSSGDARPDVSPGAVEGAVTAAGRIEGTDIEIFAWRTNDPANGACLQAIGFRARHGTCSGTVGDGARVAGPLVFPRLDETTGQSIDVVVVWQVPAETSIVVASTGEVSRFQRPRGSVVAFTFDSGTSEVLLRALTSDEQMIKLQEVRLEDGRGEGEASTSLDGVPESCPVTVPGDDAFTPPSETPQLPPEVYDEVWFGTPELWTLIKPGGEINSRRWLGGDRTFWWSENFSPDEPGEVVVTVEQHGGTGSIGRFSATAGSGFDPFMLQSTHHSVTMVGVEVPEPGCWELTAEYKGSEVSYVLWFDR